MKYANYDSNGVILGWYDDEIHESIPTPNVVVSEQDWQTAIDGGHNRVTPTGVTSYESYVPTEAELKVASVNASKEALKKTEVAETRDGYERMTNAEQIAMDTFRSGHFDNIAAGGSSEPNDPPAPSTDLQSAFNKFGI